jgi:hypothetical protein
MMSIKEIKAQLDQRGIGYEGVLEKSELLKLLNETPSSGSSSSVISMSVSELKEIVRSLAGRVSQCNEKIDLYNLARELLSKKTCSICLDHLLLSPSEVVLKPPCCQSYYHDHCLRDWVFKSVVEGGIYPHKCPSCSEVMEDSFVVKKLVQAGNDPKYLRYIASVEGIKRQRNLSSTPLSSVELQQLRDLGFRSCPKCHAWIEKGPAMEAFGIPVAEGCDKMTCRCGCQFCYNCGALNADCSCTGPEHGFFSHQEVMSDYPRSHLESSSGALFAGISNLFH